MNVLEQLKAMGFEEEPLRFDTGGGDFGGWGDGSGQGGGYGGGIGYGGAGDVSMDVGTTTTATTASGPSAADIAAADAIATMGANQLSGASLNEGIANALAEVVSANVSSPWGSSPGQFAKSALEGLASLGYGKMAGLNVANPSQSVDNLLASANFAQYGVPVAMAIIPGASFAFNAAKTFGALAEGKTSLADVAKDFGLQALAGKIGVPGGVLTGLAKGDVGGALQSAGMGLAQSAFSQATGLPGGLFGTGLSLAMGSGAFGGQGGTSVGTGDAGSGGFNFSGVGGAETYSPTEQLQQSFNPMSVAGGYGVNVNDALANVIPGLQKAPYGSTPYSMEV